jgi:hypothetical protein
MRHWNIWPLRTQAQASGEPMSLLGQKAKFSLRANVFRFAPESGHRALQSACLFRATSGLMHRSKQLYSITSSARESSVGGTVRRSAFAVFKLITNSNLVGCSTGRSAGFAPLKILSTKTAARR